MAEPHITLVVATRNVGKVREFATLLADLRTLELRMLSDFPGLPDVVEDRPTFEANACKKASEMAHALRATRATSGLVDARASARGCLVLADDSGLEVDALGGQPGVFSARYAGTHGADEANNDKLLRELHGVPDERRTARYRVVLALADLEGPLGEQVQLADGACEGTIRHQRRGEHGFGYDPLFQPRGYSLTMAELAHDEKNRISHRALATQKIKQFLTSYLPSRAARP